MKGVKNVLSNAKESFAQILEYLGTESGRYDLWAVISDGLKIVSFTRGGLTYGLLTSIGFSLIELGNFRKYKNMAQRENHPFNPEYAYSSIRRYYTRLLDWSDQRLNTFLDRFSV